MNRADDIAILFSSFGASADSYKEIEPHYDYQEQPLVPLGRLPIKPASPVLVPDPIPAQTAPIPTVETTLEASAKIQAAIDAVLDVDVNIPTASEPLPAEPIAEKPSPERVFAQSIQASAPASLRSLLEKAAQARLSTQSQEVPVAPVRIKARIVAVVSAKGGAGRSTLTSMLASTLHPREGGQVFAVDLDPQNALQFHFGIQQAVPGIAQACLEDRNWRDVCLPGLGNCQFVPYGKTAVTDLQRMQQTVANDGRWLFQQLQRMELSDKDVVILDLPAGTDESLQQALDIADHLVLVMLPDAASYRALDQMMRRLEPCLGKLHPPTLHCIINQLDPTHGFSMDMGEVLKQGLGIRPLGVVHLDRSIREALAYECNPMDQVPLSQGCQDIQEIAKALSGLLSHAQVHESSLS
ncbi:cellulose biosynthesis protein BcsQ [Pseudomonas fluorescens]|uniref:Iron-sulfur cluster carrier protein n=1 Tax=Pseudomonas fluorescens TaxID=294 RepID=A0A5E7ESQ6_PSEFL|nr:cellulose biosynthesis protein BcsQ [Pseudomonas fluorescens]VVO28633.1 Iron-sulfur cluster carrier protein [Pseudomonas fluorescens]